MPLEGCLAGNHDAAMAGLCFFPLWLCLLIGGLMFGGANVAYQVDEAAVADWTKGSCEVIRGNSSVVTMDCGRGNRVHQAWVAVKLTLSSNETKLGTALKRPSWRKECGGENNCGTKYCFDKGGRAAAKRFLAKFADGATYPCWYDPKTTARIALRNNGSPLKETWIAGLVLLCLGGVVLLASPPLVAYVTRAPKAAVPRATPVAAARAGAPGAAPPMAQVVGGAKVRPAGSRPYYERSPSGDHMYVHNA